LTVLIAVVPEYWPFVTLVTSFNVMGMAPGLLVVVVVVAMVDVLPLLHFSDEGPRVVTPPLPVKSVVQLPLYLYEVETAAPVTPATGPPVHPPILPVVFTVAVTVALELSFGSAGLTEIDAVNVLQVGPLAAAAPLGDTAATTPMGMSNAIANNNPVALRIRTPLVVPPDTQVVPVSSQCHNYPRSGRLASEAPPERWGPDRDCNRLFELAVSCS
jgi:hypothetical protein